MMPSTGWNIAAEDRDFLAAGTALFGVEAPADYQPPPTFNFRDKLRVENQGALSSCVGHGGSSGLEALIWLQANASEQMSRMFCYLVAQRYSGISGDRGATISGCVQALREVGCCYESTFPYPARYGNRIPPVAAAEAPRFKILGHRKLHTYFEVRDWIAQGKGPVIFGCQWYHNLANSRGVITPDDLRGPTLGGHCNLFVGYSGERDREGELMIDGLNSHGTGWGDQGWAQWTSRAIDALGNDPNSELIGITNITGFDPQRLVNFSNVV